MLGHEQYVGATEPCVQCGSAMIDVIREVFRAILPALEARLDGEAGSQTPEIVSHATSLLSADGIGSAECTGITRDKVIGALATGISEAFAWPGRAAAVELVCRLARAAENKQNILFCEAVRAFVGSGNWGEIELKECDRVLGESIQDYRTLCSTREDWRRLALMLSQRGNRRCDIGILDHALKDVDEAIGILSEIQDHRSTRRIEAQGTRAKILIQQGRYHEAIGSMRTR